jgi:hypothetical protein
MLSRHSFLPLFCVAVVFTGGFFAPKIAFSAAAPAATPTAPKTIEDSKTVEEASTQYLAETNKLISLYRPGQSVSSTALSSAQSNIDLAKANSRLDTAKENEQSTANKLLGGLTMAATGIGGMQLAQGLAEKNADEAASEEMKKYLATIKCGVSGARNVSYNEVSKTPAETREFSDLRLKYLDVAKKMKSAKENLGMAPGIESELLADTSNLYDNSGTDTDGIAHNFDTATERADDGSGKKRALIGGAIAGVGVIGGAVGNKIINNQSDKGTDAKSGSDSGSGLLSNVGALSGTLGKAKESGLGNLLGK